MLMASQIFLTPCQEICPFFSLNLPKLLDFPHQKVYPTLSVIRLINICLCKLLIDSYSLIFVQKISHVACRIFHPQLLPCQSFQLIFLAIFSGKFPETKTHSAANQQCFFFFVYWLEFRMVLQID